MGTRRPLIFVFVGVFASMGASYQTTNFVVEAPNAQVAQQAGQYAEYYRKQKAEQWLGREMPQWPEPCPLKVTVTMGGAGGATSFAFDRGRVLGQQMHIEGSYERLMNSVLPHEVTHTVFAYYFRTPVPRWADEGGAVLSEDDLERNRHDMLCRQILNTPGRTIPLRRLFTLKDYPHDVMALYAEGYSVSNFLVSSSSRPVFLQFVAQGMREGWDRAAQVHYHYNSVEALEEAWVESLNRASRPPAQLANNGPPPAQFTNSSRPQPQGEPAGRILVRQTAPPAQPLDEGSAPVYRGRAADEDWNYPPRYDANGGRAGVTNSGWNSPRSSPPQARLEAPIPEDRWQPSAPPVSPNAVQLGPPDFAPPGGAGRPGGPMPGPVVGYPR